MIQKVKVDNWKSHFESEFEFSSGVNVLVGEMGSGKSSVLEAICFALFGTTPALNSRTVKLDNLIRRNPSPADEASVEVEFKIGEDTYRVKRKIERREGTTEAELRKNNSLIESPSPTKVTDRVEKILDMDFDLFSRAIYSEQNNLDYFLKMRAGKRKKKIDELLKLHKFEKARKNTVSIKNRIKDLRDTREKDLDSLKEKEELEEIPEIKEKVKNAEEELDSIEEELEENKKKLEEVNKDYNELKDKKEKYEKLKDKKTQIESDLKSSEKRISQESEETALEAEEYTKEEIQDKIKELEDKLNEQKEKKEEINELEKKLSEKKSLLNKSKEELKNLKDKKDKLKILDEVSQKLEKKQDVGKELEKSIQEINTKISELKEHIEPLKEGVSKCPVCGSQLNESKRENLLEERKDSIENLKSEKKEKSGELKKVKNDVDELQKKKEDLMEFKNIEEKIESKKESLEGLNEKTEEIKGKIEDKEEEIEELDREELENNKKDFEVLEKIKKLESEKEELKEKLDYLKNKIKELEFDEDKLENLREEKNDLEKKIEVLKNKKDSKKELLQEKKKRFESLKQDKEKLKDLEDKIEQYEVMTDFLLHFKSSLEGTQTDLRERFIGSLNKFMDEIWQKVYPYEDYSSIRLNVEGDYVLELLNEEEEWIPVEGEVSGGERHTAALSMRIALALILSPGMKILILDEPTHNLDSRAIKDLGETMRSKVSDLVDQLFLITHEERLESAVTGNFYKLSKKETGSGLTEVVESGNNRE